MNCHHLRKYIVLQVLFLYLTQCVTNLGWSEILVSPSSMIYLSMSAYGQEEDAGTSWFLLKRKEEEPYKRHGKKSWDMNWQRVKSNNDKDEKFWHKWQPTSHLPLMPQASNQRKGFVAWRLSRGCNPAWLSPTEAMG